MSLTTLAAMYAPGNERDDTTSYAGTEDMQTRSVGQPTQHAAALRSFPHQTSSDDIESDAEVPEGVQKPDNLPEGTKLPAPGTWSRSAGRAPVAVTADVHYRPGSMRPTYSSPAINQSADSQQQQRPTHARANTAQGVAGAPRPVNYSRPTTPSAAKNPPPALGSEGNDAMPQPHPTSPPPQYHRPLAGASAVVTPQSSPAKAAPPPATTPSSVLARPSPRKRERGPPPSAFNTSGYNIASDFRISPAAHAAAQPQPSPQARRSAVESARAKALRKGRAPTRLNVMVVGEAGQGKTLFLRSLLQTLLGEVGEMSDVEEPLATVPGDARTLLQSFGLNARGKQGRTRQISLVEGIELVPDQEVLLNGIVDEEAEQHQQARPSLRRNASSTSIGGGGRRRRRGSNVSRTSASMSLLGSAAPPNRLSLTLIDTPGVPSVLPQSLLSLHANASSTIPAPAFLRPVLDEITSRYARTLKEESKLRRVPSKTGAGGDSEHVHVVVWFVSPTEILEGGRTWWREEQERQIWEKRERREKERQQAEREKVEALKAEQEKAMMREAQDAPLRSPSKKGSKSAAGGRPDGAQHQRRRTTSNPARPSSSSSSSAANGNAARHQGGGEKASGEVERRGSGRKRANSLKGIFQDLKIGSTDAPLPPRREASGALSPAIGATSTDDDGHGFGAAQGKDEDEVNGDAREGEDQGDDDEDYYDESHYEATLSPSQKLVLSHLLPLVPVLPIIARAETLTTQQLESARRGVQRGWQEVVNGLEKSAGRQRKLDSIGSPATESWGWIGFGGAAGQAAAAKKAGRRRQQQQQRQSDDEDEEEDEEGGTSGEDVKLIRIKSRRSYSSQAARNLGGSSTTGHGAAEEEEERLRESPIGRRQRESSDGGSASGSGSAIGHTSPLFARPPAYKKALNRSGSQSSSAVAHGAGGAGGQEESEVETEEHFDPADPDPRLLLGVQDVVPSKTQMEGRWPLAIWAPEPALLSTLKGKAAQQGPAGGRAQKLQEASNQLEGAAVIKERGDTQGEERNGLQEGGGEDVRFSMIPMGGSNSAGATAAPTNTATTTAAAANPTHSTTHHQPLPLTRTYPWGSTLHLLNPSQSDFLALKAMLLGTHTGVILETSKEAFESWRGETLELQQRLKEKEKGVGVVVAGEGKQQQQRGADGQWVVL